MTRPGGRAWMKVRARVLQRDGYTCAYCRRGPLPPAALHVDHATPLARGGPAWDEGNMVAACAQCNLSKGARPGPPPAATARRPGW